MPADLLLIIDLGTQSLRATLFDRAGSVHWQQSQPIATQRSEHRCEQDANQWAAAVHDVLRAIAAQPAWGANLAGIAATGTLAGLVCLDAAGTVLRPALLYADPRPAAQVAELEAHADFAPVREQAGWRAAVGDFLPQLAYLRRQEPTLYAQSSRLLDSTGFLNHLLTGRAVMDAFTLSSCYALPGSEALPHRLLKAFDLDQDKLGEPIAIGQRIGTLRGRFGLPECPVFSVPYDSACAYLGAYLHEAGQALDISGTVTSFGVLHPAQVRDPLRRIYSLPREDPRFWLVRGSTASAGAALEWARTVLLRGTHADLDRLVAESPPGANGVLFLPYLSGERAPLWNPEATGSFSGLRASTSFADMMRAVVEGICYALRHIQIVMEENGVRIGDVLLAGGLSRNPRLNQIKAGITGRRLIPLADYELTTLGAASLAGHALGWWSRAEAATLFLSRQAPVDPDPAERPLYDAAFARYLAATKGSLVKR